MIARTYELCTELSAYEARRVVDARLERHAGRVGARADVDPVVVFRFFHELPAHVQRRLAASWVGGRVGMPVLDCHLVVCGSIDLQNQAGRAVSS